MAGKKQFVYWQDGDVWLRYLLEYRDYLSQAGSLEELELKLKDIYHDLQSDEIPCVGGVGELELA